MSIKVIVITIISILFILDVPVSCSSTSTTLAPTTESSTLTCDNIKCPVNQICSACGQNVCNIYNCSNPDGSKIRCLFKCPKLNPTCICKPGYYRKNASCPCAPLNCTRNAIKAQWIDNSWSSIIWEGCHNSEAFLSKSIY